MHIIAHRAGAEKNPAKENSLEAIREMLELNIDMIELDIRLHNGELVLSHDPTSQEKSYTNLVDVFQLVQGKKPLNLEIKDFDSLQHIIPVIESYTGPILLSSFSYKVLWGCHSLLPHIPLAVLEKWSGVRAAHRARKFNIKRIHMNQRWLWRGFNKHMVNNGYELYAYTVNSKKQADTFSKHGISGIFTDYPKKFIAQ